MNTLIIILLSISILLFILSFFQPDKTKTIEKDMEQLSMKILQENYLLKKRVKILEEELLLEESSFNNISKPPATSQPNEILKNHVIALYNQGLDLKQISKQSSLPIQTIRSIVNNEKRVRG